MNKQPSCPICGFTGGYATLCPNCGDILSLNTTRTDQRGEEDCVQRVAIPRRELQLGDALDYEINASWWANWIGSPTLQNWAGRYYAWKASRKWAQYRKSKDRARRVKRYSEKLSDQRP